MKSTIRLHSTDECYRFGQGRGVNHAPCIGNNYRVTYESLSIHSNLTQQISFCPWHKTLCSLISQKMNQIRRCWTIIRNKKILHWFILTFFIGHFLYVLSSYIIKPFYYINFFIDGWFINFSWFIFIYVFHSSLRFHVLSDLLC